MNERRAVVEKSRELRTRRTCGGELAPVGGYLEVVMSWRRNGQECPTMALLIDRSRPTAHNSNPRRVIIRIQFLIALAGVSPRRYFLTVNCFELPVQRGKTS